MRRQNPLSYQSSKSVFEHFELNKRVSFLRRIPDFQQLHLTVPAKAKTLRFDWNSVTINDFTHTIEIVSLPGEVSHRFGVAPLESYGTHRLAENTHPANNIMVATPGNLLIYLRNQDSYLASPGQRSYTYYTVKNAAGEKVRSILLPNGILPSDATRKLIEKFFVGRKNSIVGTLAIDVVHGFLRVPTGFCVNPHHLKIAGHACATLNSIMPILDKESFPLRSLEINIRNDTDPVFNNEVAVNADKICINHQYLLREIFTGMLPKLKNREILLTDELNWRDISTHLNEWMSTPQPIGRKVTMMSETPQYQMTSLRLLLKNRAKFCTIPNKECARSNFALTVQVTDVSELNIYIYKAPNYEEEVAKGCSGKRWALIWEIMELGTAVIMENVVI